MSSTDVELVPESVIESMVEMEANGNTEERMVAVEVVEENGAVEVTQDFLGDGDSESEDDFVVTIGEIKETVPYQKKAQQPAGGNKVELDGTPAVKGTQIYDLDLATMEDKPWRKPGADITDYFNYGFNEDTWNQYCERQRKLRVEFSGNQEAINRAIFSSISLPSVPHQLTTQAGGRQLVSIMGGDNKPTAKHNKMVIDLSKPPPQMETNQVPIMRTVISGSGTITQNIPTSVSDSPLNTSKAPINFNDYPVINVASANNTPTSPSISSSAPNQIPTLGNMPTNVIGGQQPTSPIMGSVPSLPNFSRPPPSQSDFSKPPPSFESGPPPAILPGMGQGLLGSGPPSLAQPVIRDVPPGFDDADLPPGASSPPPGLSSHLGSMGGLNTSVPPPSSFGGFNPNVPPPGVAQARIGMPQMNIPPPSVYGQFAPATGGFGGGQGPSPNMGGYSRQPLLMSGSRGPPGVSNFSTLPPGTEPQRPRISGGTTDFPMNIKTEQYSSGGESDDEDYRRKRRRRSKSPVVRRKRGDDQPSSSSYRDSSRRHDSPHDRSGVKRKSEREREKERSADKKRSSTREEKDKESEEKDRKRKKHEKEK